MISTMKTDKCEVLVALLRAKAFYSDQDRIMLVETECSVCRDTFEEALGEAVSNASRGLPQVCIKCDEWANR